MNFAALRKRKGPSDGSPRTVLWQYADPDECPMNPFELLMAYEEHGRVLPVVSDFDPFLVGSRRVPFDPVKGALPPDQVEIMKWSVSNIAAVLDSKSPDNWTNRWLEVLQSEGEKGFHPKIPRFGFGDPKSYSIIENAVARLGKDGAVRHGAECFNYYFPQELDEEFLVISHVFEEGLPWQYMDAEGLQEFLSARVDDNYTFPLNPKWILCDPGWKIIYDKLLASENEEVKASMQVWFPEESGVRDQIEEIHSRHSEGFQRISYPRAKALDRTQTLDQSETPLSS